MSEEITISVKNYIALLCNSERLRRLENGGVDNWEWYGEAMNPDGEPDMDDFETELIERIAKENE